MFAFLVCVFVAMHQRWSPAPRARAGWLSLCDTANRSASHIATLRSAADLANARAVVQARDTTAQRALERQATLALRAANAAAAASASATAAAAAAASAAVAALPVATTNANGDDTNIDVIDVDDVDDVEEFFN